MVSLMLKKLYQERSTPAVVNANGGMFQIKAKNQYETYLRDQVDPIRSVTDLHLVCEDGHIPVHRYIVMGTSPFIKEILSYLDPSELAVIHLPDVKLSHVVQVLSLVYTGKAVISKLDQIPVFSVMKMLGISTRCFEFRSSKPTDYASIPKLRSYKNDDGELDREMEQTYVDVSLINGIRHDQATSTSNPISSVVNSVIDIDNNELVVKSGPKLSTKISIGKSDAQRLLKLKVELPEDPKEDLDENKCYFCGLRYVSMNRLIDHLKNKCGSKLKSKYTLNDQQCVVCNCNFPMLCIGEMLLHVNECKGKLRLVPSPKLAALNSLCMEACAIGTENEQTSCLELNSSSFVNGVGGQVMESIGENTTVEKPVPIIEVATTEPASLMEVKSIESVDWHLGRDAVSSIDLSNGVLSNPSSKKRRRRRPAMSSKTRLKRRRTRQNGTDGVDEVQEVENKVKETALGPNNEELCSIRISCLDSLTDKDNEPLSDEAEDEISPQFICEIGVVDPIRTVNKQFRDVDPDLVRMEFGVSSPDDMPRLSNFQLRKVFRQCPLCKNLYQKIKYVSKCLRLHGYRYCWVCLKLLPYKGVEFDNHSKVEHCVGEYGDKVTCSLCWKEFEYKLALPTHLGNYHCARLQETCSSYEDSTLPVGEESFKNSELTENKLAKTSKGMLPNPLSAPALAVEAKRSKLRDILTGPSASTSNSDTSNGTGRTTRRRSAESERDGRLIVKLGEKLALYKGSKIREPREQRNFKILVSELEVFQNSDGNRIPSESLQSQKPTEADLCSSTLCTVEERSCVSSTSKISTFETAMVKERTQCVNTPEKTIMSPQSGRIFVAQKMIDGCPHDIYCLTADSKKTIAIPATARIRKS